MQQGNLYKTPTLGWVQNPWFDILFVLGLPFFIILAIILCQIPIETNLETNNLQWFILVLCVDVAHVYSTLYRTYFDKNAFNQNKNFFTLTPIFVFNIALLLAIYDLHLFWTILAYLAVFHFVRQQYGFLRIYQKKNNVTTLIFQQFEQWVLYAGMLFPIIYWHLKPDLSISWFVKNDFIFLENKFYLWQYFLNLFYVIEIVYFVWFVYCLFKYKNWSMIPAFVLVLGTTLAWFIGIVLYNNDLVFTLLNVLCHGIPYLALVFIYKMKSEEKQGRGYFKILFFYLIVLFAFAFTEEAFWDNFVWNEKQTIFGNWGIELSYLWKAFFTALLTVPQATHYILDAYIWKIKKDTYGWKKYFKLD
ncbi:MAG: hypothetical protein RLZZ175_1948 [Bacteroidota bacterium]|jgi:hypothetical protein